MASRIELLCQQKGVRLTEQRRIVARVLSDAHDHPDVELVYRRASAIEPKIGIATVYRTVRLLEEAGILNRVDFGGARARYEEVPEEHHDHLIDVKSGNRSLAGSHRQQVRLSPDRPSARALRRAGRPGQARQIAISGRRCAQSTLASSPFHSRCGRWRCCRCNCWDCVSASLPSGAG
jgi:Fe2+ or Zn2+ uptake regulation protein